MSRSRLGPDCAITLPASLSPHRRKGDQLREVLERLAADLGPGQQIPSERFLSEHFSISRGTTRQVITQLVADGVLLRRPGNATFTAEAPASAGDMITSFTADILARGLTPATVLLGSDIRTADPETAGKLDLQPGAPIFYLERLRLVNGEPLAVERTNLPMERFPGIADLDWQTRSLHQTLWDHYHVRPERNESSITAVLPTADDADRLELGPGQPCLVIEAVARTADHLALEVGRSFYRADRHAVLARFHRPPPGQPATTPPTARDAATAMAEHSEQRAQPEAPLEPHS